MDGYDYITVGVREMLGEYVASPAGTVVAVQTLLGTARNMEEIRRLVLQGIQFQSGCFFSFFLFLKSFFSLTFLNIQLTACIVPPRPPLSRC